MPSEAENHRSGSVLFHDDPNDPHVDEELANHQGHANTRYDPSRRNHRPSPLATRMSSPCAGYAVSGFLAVTPIIGRSGVPAITLRIERAFLPLIDVVQAVAQPIGVLMIMVGCMLILLGQRRRGLEFIKNAVIGYIALQFAPAMMSLVMEVGRAMRP